MSSESSPAPPPDVRPAWRTLAVGLMAGLAAYAAAGWHHDRALRDDGGPAPAVREVAPPDPPDPRLGRVLDRVDLEDVSRADAAAAVGRLAGIGVVPKWDTDRNGPKIKAAERVTLHLRGVTAAAAFDAVLDDLSRSDDRLGWVERGGVVTVAEQGRLDADPASVVVRVYDVRPLLAQSKLQPSPSADDAAQGFGSHGYVSPQNQERNRELENEDELTHLIEEHVAAESWQVNGGDRLLSVWAGQLVVTQTERNQRAVEAFLQLLSRRRRAG